jgi:eukaryotic-like serine/threonine-protein kinase
MSVAGARPLLAGDPAALGGVELLGRLGEGGMGVVYLGRTSAGVLVAVKAIRGHLAGEPGFRRRFRSEVTQVRQVPPYCTAEVLDADPDSDPPYLVVEYVDGPTLSDVVAERGPLTPANLHSVAIGVATALTAIHGAGVIHRDLKPSNVLLAQGSLKVIDFGIARPVADASTLTDEGEIVGTVSYMAPERFGPEGSKLLTPAADVFAWGAVVAYAGTGHAPFPADSAPGIAMRIVGGEPELDGLPPALRALVERALAKEPGDRPTARSLLDMLTSSGDAAPISVPPNLASPLADSAIATQAGAYPATRAVPTAVVRPTGPASAASAALAGTRPAARSGSLYPSAAAAPPRRRGRWRVLTGALAAVLILGLAAGIATRVIPLPFANAAAADNTTSPTPGATGSVPTSESPSPSVNALLAGMTKIQTDSLSPPTAWQDLTDTKNHASCAATAKGLIVTRGSDSPFRCPGPKDLLYDTAVFVDVQLFDTASCATVWLRFNTSGYAVRVCHDGYIPIIHGFPSPNNADKLCDPIPSTLDAGHRIRVGVVLRGNEFTFLRDGKQIGRGSCSDPADTFHVGHVVLGIFPSVTLPSGTPTSQVQLSNVEIWGSTT